MSKHTLRKNRKWIINICPSLNLNCTNTSPYNTKHKYQHDTDKEITCIPFTSASLMYIAEL